MTTYLATITTGEGIVIGCAIIGLVLLYSQTADRWSWGAPFRWTRSFFPWIALKFSRAQRRKTTQTPPTETKRKRLSAKWIRRSITVLIAVSVLSGIVTFILYKKGHFRYVDRDDLIEAGPEGDELWGWVEEDKRGPYTGWVRKWSSDEQSRDKKNGYLEEKYFVKAGKLDGNYEKWSEEGEKLEEGHFDNGKQEGDWSVWYENGQKKAEIHYGLINFVETAIVWKPNGVPCPTTRVINGNGTMVFYHENSEKMEETTLSEGVRTGPNVSWHENGQKSREGDYSEGKKNGDWTQWHENGQKSGEGVYKDGNKEGKWIIWYDNGEKEEENIFKNGRKEGNYTFWHDNGEKWEEGIFKDGKREGESQRWRKDGTFDRNYFYKDGKEIGK